MTTSDEDVLAIEAAFETAQARTSAPLICVLAPASSDYALPPLLWSGLIALATPWPLLMFTPWSAEKIFIVQILVCLVALATLSLTPIRPWLTPARMRRAQAHRAALVQFSIRGLDRAPLRNGVLLYVSLAERYARVIADAGACKDIDATRWQGLIDALTNDLAAKGTREALTSAAARAGDLLATPFPAAGGPPRHGSRFHKL